MRSPVLIPIACFLAACGMKGDLYEAPPPAAEATEPVAEPETGETDKGERKTIPSTPDPAKSE